MQKEDSDTYKTRRYCTESYILGKPLMFWGILVFTLLPFYFFTFSSAQKHRGKASFYSKKATGARSSSGERIHHDSLTCAHRTLPFGTLLKVTNLSNGKSCVVRVNDRGPHSRGRIIDLSYGAARELGMLSQGIAMVEVERVGGLKIPYRENPVETGFPDFEFDISDLMGIKNGDLKDNILNPKDKKALQKESPRSSKEKGKEAMKK